MGHVKLCPCQKNTRPPHKKTAESVLTHITARDILLPHTEHGRQGSLLPQLDGGHRAAGPAFLAESTQQDPDRRADSWHTEVQLPMPNLDIDQRKRVLIVDQSADSRHVFRTVLERRGVQILEAPGARQGLEILRQQRPEVVILDLEAEAADDAAVRAAYDTEMAEHRAELVVLGNLRRSDMTADQHVVRKPYHYGPLIRKIEELIEHSANLRPSSPSECLARTQP